MKPNQLLERWPGYILVAGITALTGCTPAGWERMDAPDIKGQPGISAVEGFVAANGWNMSKSPMILAMPVARPARRLRGLPWTRLTESTYPALTSKGILYVALVVQGRSASGVAYNPNTNQFPNEVAGFKPLADHWYAWKIVAEGPAHRPNLTRR